MVQIHLTNDAAVTNDSIFFNCKLTHNHERVYGWILYPLRLRSMRWEQRMLSIMMALYSAQVIQGIPESIIPDDADKATRLKKAALVTNKRPKILRT